MDTREVRGRVERALASSGWLTTAQLATIVGVDARWALEELIAMTEDGEAACRLAEGEDGYEWAGPDRISGYVAFGPPAVDLLQATLDLRERMGSLTPEEAAELAADRASIARHRERERWRPRPLNDIAVRINDHLRRFDDEERDRLPPGSPPAADPPSGRRMFRAPSAFERRRGTLFVRYDFTAQEYTLDADEAARYLAWLDGGNVGRHLDIPPDFSSPAPTDSPSGA